MLCIFPKSRGQRISETTLPNLYSWKVYHPCPKSSIFSKSTANFPGCTTYFQGVPPSNCSIFMASPSLLHLPDITLEEWSKRIPMERSNLYTELLGNPNQELGTEDVGFRVLSITDDSSSSEKLSFKVSSLHFWCPKILHWWSDFTPKPNRNSANFFNIHQNNIQKKQKCSIPISTSGPPRLSWRASWATRGQRFSAVNGEDVTWKWTIQS